MLNTFLALYLSKEELILFEEDFPLKQIIRNYLIRKIESISEKYLGLEKDIIFHPIQSM